MIYLVLFLLVGTFLNEYEASYVKLHHARFSPMEYIWVMAIGSLVVNIGLYVFLGGYDRTQIDLRVIGGTIVLTGLSRYFLKLSFHTIDTTERSTAANFGVLSIPLVLLSDILLGYTITRVQIIVMVIMAVIFLASSMKKGGLSREGLKYALATMFTGVVATILFKYVTTHRVSLQMQMLLTSIGTLLFLSLSHINVLRGLLFRKADFRAAGGIALFHGAASILNSYAFFFGLASVVITVKRVAQLMWGLVFGKIAFHEHHIARKTVITLLLALCVIGLQFPSLLYALFYSA